MSATKANRHRAALVGTGHRGLNMWGRGLLAGYGDFVDMVALFDVNPMRAERVRDAMGIAAPVHHRVRRHDACATAGSGDRLHARCRPRSVHRGGAGGRRRRHHREADGDHGGKMPPHHRGRAAHREARRCRVQLPLFAAGEAHQGTAARRQHRHGDLGRFPLVSRYAARRRLFPPLACDRWKTPAACGCTRRRIISTC